MGRPRLLLADDHALILEGMRAVLAGKFEIAGAELNGRDLVAAAERLKPDAVLLDVYMPVLNGIEASRLIKGRMPATKIIFVSQMSDPNYVRAAFQAGASAYVLKQCVAAEIVSAVEQAISGYYYFSPAMRHGSPPGFWDCKLNPAEMFAATLTTRQREVLQLVAEGRSNKEIGSLLRISVKTVEFHKAGLMDHLGIRTTAELTRYAIEQGLLPPANSVHA